MIAKQANTAWLFYKHYYSDIDFNDSNESTQNEARFDRHNQRIFKTQLDTKLAQSLVLGKDQFKLQTTYPGLLIGSGYTHETGRLGEIKIGFFFDHTSGLPVLPGSSVKGALRNAFPAPLKEKYKKEEDKVQDQKLQQNKEKYIRSLLPEGKRSIDIAALRDSIFEGKNRGSMYAHDTFYDAIPTAGRRLFSNDFITPHDSAFKNPIPIQFLKVLPEITYTFSFDLQDDNYLTAKEKVQLFEAIILDLGVGAKTSVGYGAMRVIS